MEVIFSALFWALFATILACVEIESEGKFGWAQMAPTWYRTTGWPARLYGLFMGGKPLTGYHLFMFFLPVFIFHAHFFMGIEWSVAQEFKAWAMYFAWCILWDYHWFVLNPFYRGKFSQQHIWWHAKSYWMADIFPFDYAVGWGFSIVFAALASTFGSVDFLDHHLRILTCFAAYTIILHKLAPFYHAWYTKMRERDDRDSADIFHR